MLIEEIFRRDPLELTRADIKDLCTVYRENRAKFKLGNMNAGKAPKSTAKQEAAKKVTGKLDISNLL